MTLAEIVEWLERVAQLSDGIAPDAVDWKNCVAIARHEARAAIAALREMEPVPGSLFLAAGPVAIGCMSPQARDLMDRALSGWEKHLATRSEPPEEPVYAFAYWLFRWSGLIFSNPLAAKDKADG